tara:strand:+ start:257 stop:403 length:147 start_codon:yes stop_codon:yes gene_type:complete
MIYRMNIDFFEKEEVQDAIMDIFIDQLHKYADLENEETTSLVSNSLCL